jgi:hypothetical protein
MEEIDFQKEDIVFLREAVNLQPAQAPSDTVRVRLMVVAASGGKKILNQHWAQVRQWVMGFGLAVLTFTLLWVWVKPGVVLGWTVNGLPPAAYRIYRAPTSDGEQMLIREIKASEGGSYQFVDLFVLSAAQYTYTVEGLTSNGGTITSQPVTVDTSQVLLTQVVILAASLLVGWGIVALLNSMKTPFFVRKAWQ